MLSSAGCSSPAAEPAVESKSVRPSIAKVSAEEAQAIAQEAYIFLYTLITMDVTRRQATNIEAGKMSGRVR
jgi:hypothetical protein